MRHVRMGSIHNRASGYERARLPMLERGGQGRQRRRMFVDGPEETEGKEVEGSRLQGRRSGSNSREAVRV